MWFAASLTLAFFVWILASTQSDPVSEQRFRTRIPVAMELDNGMTVVEQQTNNVWVTIRAQASVQENLTAEDIIVRADLRGYGPGTHTIELDTDLARRGVADTQPRQITVTLEEIQVQQVQVIAEIPEGQDLPANFTRQAPIFSESQVMIRGVTSRVQQVAAARASIDLRDRRSTFRGDVRLIPIDADGQIVPDVVVEPQFVEVTIEIRQRDDLREVSVSPRIDTNSLADDYTLSAISYQPQTVFLVGTRAELVDVVTPLTTAEIDLTGRTTPFEITVPIVFPGAENSPILGEPSVTVFLEIRAQTATRQFENIPIEIIGLADDNLQAEASLGGVVVLVTGSAPVIRELNTADVVVLVDVNGLGVGTYDLTPRVSIGQAQIDLSGVTVNPATITVNISLLEDITPTPTTSP